ADRADREIDVERGGAGAVRRDRREAQERLAFTVSRGIAGRVREEFEAEGRARDAVQASLNVRRARSGGHRSDDRESLEVVRARVGVAGVVGRFSGRAEVDTEAPVAEDRVAENRVAGDV